MNLMGNLAGASSTMVGGFLLSQAGGDWNQFITLLASVYFLGVPCWAFLNPRTPIDAAPIDFGRAGAPVAAVRRV